MGLKRDRLIGSEERPAGPDFYFVFIYREFSEEMNLT